MGDAVELPEPDGRPAGIDGDEGLQIPARDIDEGLEIIHRNLALAGLPAHNTGREVIPAIAEHHAIGPHADAFTFDVTGGEGQELQTTADQDTQRLAGRRQAVRYCR